MKTINFEETLKLMSMEQAISVLAHCFADFEAGEISQKPRSVEILPDGGSNVFAIMPAYLGPDRLFGCKIITAFPGNRSKNLPSHTGEVLLFDSETGHPLALIDANAITYIRTAAVSGLATKYLANENAETLAIIGAGQQSHSHLEAMRTVREIKTVYLYDLNPDQVVRSITTMKEKYPAINFIAGTSIEETVKDADIICTLTPSKDAFLEPSMIKPGAHINAIGTFTPTTREITSDLMAQASIFVDDYEAIFNESGDFLIPLSEGKVTKDSIVASMGEIAMKKAAGRTSETEITLFDGVGLAVEDLCCAEFVYYQAKGE